MTEHVDHAAGSQQPMMPQPAGVVVTGPNHALHFILTLFTFWMCGGWAWVWLVVALANSRRVETVDTYGNIIARPVVPRAPRQGPTLIDRAAAWVGDWFAPYEDGRVDGVRVVIAIAAGMAVLMALATIVHLVA